MKKLYNQPEVNVAQINTMSIICASAAPIGGSGAGKLNTIPTDEQW
jgi:hypothetical protein